MSEDSQIPISPTAPTYRDDKLVGIVRVPDELDPTIVGNRFAALINDHAKSSDVGGVTATFLAEGSSESPADSAVRLENADNNLWQVSVTLVFETNDPTANHQAVIVIVDAIYQVWGLITGAEQRKALVEEYSAEIVAASVNWITGGSPAKIITGGPGSTAKVAPSRTTSYEFDIDVLKHFKTDVCAEPVIVVIMDTDFIAPATAAAWTNADARNLYQVLNTQVVKHPLPAGAVPTNTLSAGMRRHDGLASHSIFIAGIIRKIAQKYGAYVNLHLIPILNEEAEGSLVSYLAGLQILRSIIDANKTTAKPAPVVVNFSVVLPWSVEQIVDWLQSDVQSDVKLLEEADFVPSDIKSAPDRLPGFIEFMLSVATITADATQFVRDDLAAGPVNPHAPIMVAAAGNDSAYRWETAGTRFPAAFPASLQTFVGVGALDKQRQNATYSNLPDNPDWEGFRVFGGGAKPVTTDTELPEVDGGIISLYGPAPTGWGEWAGTSFATPIISAIIAVLRSKGSTKPLKDLYDLNSQSRTIIATQT